MFEIVKRYCGACTKVFELKADTTLQVTFCLTVPRACFFHIGLGLLELFFYKIANSRGCLTRKSQMLDYDSV